MTNAIEVQGLTKCYGDLMAVDHISFAVHQGEVFGFLGPNRAGRITTQSPLTYTQDLMNYAVLGAAYLNP